MVKGFGSSSLAFVAILISKATTVEWLQIASLITGLVLCVLTIAEKLWRWHRDLQAARAVRPEFIQRQ